MDIPIYFYMTFPCFIVIIMRDLGHTKLLDFMDMIFKLIIV